MKCDPIYLLRKASFYFANRRMALLESTNQLEQQQDFAVGLTPAMVKLQTSTFPFG